MYQKYTTIGGIVFVYYFFKTSIVAATYYIEIVDKLIFFSLFLVFSFSSDNLHIFEDELQQGATSIAVVNESGKVPSKTKKKIQNLLGKLIQ